MANYLITNCGGGTLIVDSGESSLTGTTYYLNFTGETSSGCYTINTETLDPADDAISTIVGNYENCLECFKNNDFSFLVSACTVPDLSGPVNANQFNELPFDSFYKLCANNGEFDGCLCFEVVGVLDFTYEFSFNISGPYTDCNCFEPSRSANTETVICEVCDGTTVILTPPHAEYSDSQNNIVIQMNTVALGGAYGLNN